MKKQIKISLLVTALLSNLVYAQAPTQQPVSSQAPTQQPVSSQAPTQQPVSSQAPTQQQIGQGNAFEKEVTPLLREISRKKSQLELRRLDRELEKIDEESLKAQLDLEKAKNGGFSNGSNGSNYDPFTGTPAAAPAAVPPPAPAPVQQVSTVDALTSDIRVLMIYGFDGQLNAKIAAGQQGGYVVKKGDVMPDGSIVANVTANYIEIKKGSNKNKGTQRIFVSSGAEASSSNSSSGSAAPTAIPGGTGSSATPLVPVNPIKLSPQAQANENAIANLLAPIPAATPNVK